ncbi:hypothetical protein [Acinetobacter larvae]|uniref:Uncharacterized protein n=1 Tax=Acinetobacter larvae TaxID=1789224 RepID=A0A1B2LZ17_9GAMM|nr:hypothetical protein [Acinetobacter larvae]AOA58198.1 hypothetical protein BFG52_07425 [Acinetobacter larvae]
MKANEFVKKFGWDAVRQIVGDCELLGDKYFIHDNSEICVYDLKRLVESHELVDECGGLEKAKNRVELEERLPNPNVFYVLVVSSAISDVEACQ